MNDYIMIDHVTYHVPPGTLADPQLGVFMLALGFRETEAKDPLYEHDANVRWWRRVSPLLVLGHPHPLLHLVEGEAPEELRHRGAYDQLVMGHFCIGCGGSEARFKALAESQWCVRNSGRGRCWLEFANLRVEVRP